LALYTDILERKGLSAGRSPFIIDINGEEFTYDLDELQGQRNPRTLWTSYRKALAKARTIVAGQLKTLAAYSSTCKLCWWHSACTKALKQADDLTLLAGLGGSKRDVMIVQVGNISEFAASNVDTFITSHTKTVYTSIRPNVRAGDKIPQ
jgi:predicted RecB family nuclease